MSFNSVSTETLCDNCVHKSSKTSGDLFFCQLLDEELIKGKLECDDWEEELLNEDNQHECD